MQFYKIEIPASSLAKLPNAYRQFFFASAMAFQEINLFLRLYAMGMASFEHTRGLGSYELATIGHSNMAMLERSVMSKLAEYRELLYAFSKSPQPEDESQKIILFRESAREVMEAWKKEKTYSLIKWYRNNASAHYGFAEHGLGALTANVGGEGDSRMFEILLHERLANTHYTMVEQLLADKFLEHGRDVTQQLQTNFAMLQLMAMDMMRLHHDFILAVFEILDVEIGQPFSVDIPIRLTWKTGTKIPLLLLEGNEPFPNPAHS
jgi:hypothetical protein